jgi:RimJ/RimL family protein N-acetyltransferase
MIARAAPKLDTDRLTLRLPEARDAEGYIAFMASPRARFVGGPLPRARGWRAFAATLGHWTIRGWGMFALEDRATGRTLGLVGPWFPDGWPEPEIAWDLWDAASEGRGYVTEAAGAVLAHVFHDLGWTTAVSYIDPANAASVRLAARLGARRDPAARGPADYPAVEVWRHTPHRRTA